MDLQVSLGALIAFLSLVLAVMPLAYRVGWISKEHADMKASNSVADAQRSAMLDQLATIRLHLLTQLGGEIEGRHIPGAIPEKIDVLGVRVAGIEARCISAIGKVTS